MFSSTAAGAGSGTTTGGGAGAVTATAATGEDFFGAILYYVMWQSPYIVFIVCNFKTSRDVIFKEVLDKGFFSHINALIVPRSEIS
jgi:hypothetical protein